MTKDKLDTLFDALRNLRNAFRDKGFSKRDFDMCSTGMISVYEHESLLDEDEYNEIVLMKHLLVLTY